MVYSRGQNNFNLELSLVFICLCVVDYAFYLKLVPAEEDGEGGNSQVGR